MYRLITNGLAMNSNQFSRHDGTDQPRKCVGHPSPLQITHRGFRVRGDREVRDRYRILPLPPIVAALINGWETASFGVIDGLENLTRLTVDRA